MQSMILICCRYQVLLGILFALLELPHAWCMLLHKFLAPEVDHWCRKNSYASSSIRLSLTLRLGLTSFSAFS